MNDELINLFGLEVKPKELWDILFCGVVLMKEEESTSFITHERRNYLQSRIALGEELLRRIPFEGNGVVESVEQKGGTNV